MHSVQREVKFAVAILLAVVGFIASACSSSAPSDSQMLANLTENDLRFSQLIKMAGEDAKLVRIANDYTWLEDNTAWPRPESELGITERRWDDYRALFSELGISEGLSRRHEFPGAVFLTMFSEGVAGAGREKGYVWSETSLSPLVPSLDDNPREPLVFRRLKGNWYLYFERSG